MNDNKRNEKIKDLYNKLIVIDDIIKNDKDGKKINILNSSMNQLEYIKKEIEKIKKEKKEKEKKEIEKTLCEINYLLNPLFFIKLNEFINYSCCINSLKNNINKINFIKDDITKHINEISLKKSESNDLIHLNEIIIELDKENKKYSDNIDDIMIKINEIRNLDFTQKN